MIHSKGKGVKKLPSRIFLLCLLFVGMSCWGGNLHANIAQVPLFLTSSVDPNIMFILDDSGSMQWEHMPEETRRFTIYLFPRPANLYGGNVYANQVPDFHDANIHNVFSRSPDNNAVFYNPMLNYTPWVDENNSPWPLPGSGNVDPTAAPYNPANLTLGSLNLTVQQTQAANWFRNTANTNQASAGWTCGTPCDQTFWPITFYLYKGAGDRAVPANYIKYQIRGDQGFQQDLDAGAESSVTTFSWTDGVTTIDRTVLEERQNFANWFTFYRSRILAARAGIGKAFATQGENLRVGFGAINRGSAAIDGVNTDTILSGVRAFSGADRTAFFNALYTHIIPTAGTPLRRALDSAGQYYSRADSSGPWSTTPGTAGGEDYACRNSYTILMTDGYWNSFQAATAACRANVDGTAGPTNTGPGGVPSFTYAAVSPFTDTHNNTLADVAMCYWKNDLRTDLDNKVPVSTLNPAFWQHMVTFGVGLGVEGSIAVSDAFSAIDTGNSVTWPAPAAGRTTENIDDLLHASVNSRGGFFSTSDPDTFATELANTLTSIMARTESSAAAIATNSTRLVDGSLIYQARFDSNDWSGELRAYPIQMDGSVIYTPQQWTAYYSSRHPTLPVPPYPGWSTSDSGKIPAHNSRSIFTWNGSDGLDFTEAQWNNLSPAQRNALIAGDVDAHGAPDVDAGKARLNWLRGENISGLRNRSVILGDIVNSDPLVVGVPNFRYELLPSGTPGRDTYQAYRSANFNRKRVLYVGANDGMLHAFDANRIDSNNTDGGSELFAYLPAGVYEHIAELTQTDYAHRYYVDGSPVVGDAYVDLYNSGATWRTILVGTLAAGGRSVFALDVTDPENFNQSNVLWEFSHPDLGYTFGQPVLARLNTGQWVVILGNGYGSDGHTAKLFILNAASGVLLGTVDTGVGTAAQPNGLSPVALLTNSERTIVAAYAGDLLGNLWKFDLSGTNVSNPGWDVAYKSGSTPAPLFSARNAAGQFQPITGPLEIGAPPTGQNGYMIYFGTGKYFESTDNDVSTPATNPGIQSLYGIWDTTAYNSQITATDRSVLVAQEIKAEKTVAVENDGSLTVRTVNSAPLAANETNYRIVSQNAVAYPGNRGWYLDLVSPVFGVQGERVVSAPLLRRGRVIFTTLIPMDDPCSTGGTSWLMELDATTGARLTKSVFDVDQDGSVDGSDFITVTIDGVVELIPVSGRQSKVGIVKTPAVIEAGTLEYKYFGGSDGGIEVVTELGGDADDFGRRSWRQLQ